MSAHTAAAAYIATAHELRVETRSFGVRIWVRLTAALADPRDAAPIAEQLVRERRPDVDATRLDWSQAFVQFAPQRGHCLYVNVPFARELGALERAVVEAHRWIGGRLTYEHETGARESTTLRGMRWQHGSALPAGRTLQLVGDDFRCELHEALLTLDDGASTDEIAVRTELGTRLTLRKPTPRHVEVLDLV